MTSAVEPAPAASGRPPRPTSLAGLAGHLWTVCPTLRHRLLPTRAPASEPWEGHSRDPRFGDARLTGRLRRGRQDRPALVVVHGLGGSWDRFYMVRAAQAAERRGWTCLRVALRGADGDGEDLYHAGLTADLAAAVESPALDGHPAVVVLGYSLGGHLALRYGASSPHPRVRAVAALCAPLDLALAQAHLDSGALPLYRHHVLQGLRRSYRAVATRRGLPAPPERLRGVRTIREYDALTVVPRFGFRDPDHYYESQSAARILDRLAVPALYVGSRCDPMVPAETVLPALAGAPPHLQVIWIDRGGHVAFPRRTALDGQPAGGTLEDAVLGWLGRTAAVA